jgi:predicted nuclease of predicted toxin-antitoxin system
MSLLIKLDENLGRSHVESLRHRGYSTDRIHDEGLSGVTDNIVWRRVCAEGRFFITLDLDFSDVRRFPPGTHPGILLLRPHGQSRQGALEVLARVVDERSLETLTGCLAVADEIYTRIRRPPAPEEPI